MPAERTVTVQLHPAQKRFHLSRATYRAFVGGRSAGKSHVGAFDLIARARAGRTYLVLAPTYTMLRDSTLRSFLKVGRLLNVLDPAHLKTSPPPELRLRTGAEVLFRSADDPERTRGPNLSGCWMDEGSLMVRDVLDIAVAALREDGEQGWLSDTFTPKGLGHWTYERFGRPQPQTELFHARTRDNPFNPPGFDRLLSGQYAEGFRRQEVEGLFVDDEDVWQVLPAAWVRAAQARWTERPPAGQALVCLGVDVAHGGADQTVIAPRYGPWVGPLRKYRGPATDSGQKAAFLVLKEHDGKAPVHVDAIGYGAPCHEALRDKIGKLAFAVNAAEATEQHDRSRMYRLTNVRALMWWKLREALDPETGDNLALPPDPELLADLTAPRFEVTASGIKVEDKRKVAERLGRSPDCGDAVALTFARPGPWRRVIFGV